MAFSLKKWSDSPLFFPVMLTVAGVLFFLLSFIYIPVASAIGYLLGWLLTVRLLKRELGKGKTYLTVLLWSFGAMALASLAALFVDFTFQHTFELFISYLKGNGFWQRCVFNTALGLLFALYSCYMCMPGKKKKQETESDFG